ncbi:5,6-dimethylbenzimidazole synthase [Roseovarius pelagicus]|uniref:5,6-dimethylbenzimidazole synthase n=1 Tax=Roseovarius pelagicus TaxID=2980108 RepID=A0ABY6DHX2_9RHOB|nr:5,6-dimethylbenzimidazole synthase [Roseovarius pelagicus]UXX84858.1 5,6-dimethylbenzimidazole synthase [Roseovarius pelagicus]
MTTEAPRFSADFQHRLTDLMRWRRDVRRFRTDPVDEALLTRCLDTFCLSPSVGLSEPWRILRLRGARARAAALGNFKAANADALAGYDGEKAQIYSRLKLSGMRDAPIQLAIFCDEETPKGAGLGAATMPETRRYSVVGAITHFWLAARARGLGVGWVSILDPDRLARDLDVPDTWRLVGYLCVGWPQDTGLTPELETAGWEDRAGTLQVEER